MQLNRFTDFGLRVLMYLTQCRDRPTAVTIPEIADRFGASRNHLVKVAHFMAARLGRHHAGQGAGCVWRIRPPPTGWATWCASWKSRGR